MLSSARSPAVLLIVDDEPLLRILAIDIAEDAGFACLEASSADEAMLFLATRADIALVFTDIEMPGSLNGLDLAKKIDDEWPSIGVIVVSGKQSPASHDLPLRGHFLAKPYDSSQLLRMLRMLTS